MKSLADSIPTFAIACLISMSGAMAANAEVSSKKIDSKGNLPIATKVTQKSSVTKSVAKQAAKPVTKKLPELSPINQAKYLKFNTPNVANQATLVAQNPEADSLRQNLKIKPLQFTGETAAPVNSPSLTFATPSAFGANWGNAFLGASASTAGKRGEVDGSINVGFGLGDSREAVGLEVSYTLGSIRRFASNGSFDAKIHRIVYAEGSNQVGVAVGMNTFAQYNNGAEQVANSSIYGAVTTYSQLQSDNAINKMPISFTVGAGGGNYRSGNASVGAFAGVGVQVAPQLSFGGGWSGVGINLGLSYVPVPSIPLTIGLTGADLANKSAGGRVLVLSIGYGFNFLPK